MIARDRFLEAMRRAASVVSVVTTAGPAGRFGTTVSSMCSVTADPPTMLACINASSTTCAAIEENGSFCVNLLGAEQRLVSDAFAGRIEAMRADRFACAEWDALTTGAPVLRAALAALDCRLTQSTLIGSHRVFVGHVVDASSREGEPLVYSNRAYRELASVKQFALDPVWGWGG